jgi:hypothetical protein
MGTVNGIYELPGAPVPPADPMAPSADVLPAYFADYERRFDLRVHRPVTCARCAASTTTRTVSCASRPTEAYGRAVRHQRDRHVATPLLAALPGQDDFAGRQLHVHDYVSADEFAGQRVVIVGAGISAVQLLEEISHVADTFWVTRREVRWDAAEFDTAARVAAIAGVEERVRRGEPPGSVISVTGQHWTPWARPPTSAACSCGIRCSRASKSTACGCRTARSSRPTSSCGRRASAPTSPTSPARAADRAGGIRVANGRAIDEPRLFLIGYGPSQSTVGANRAGRDAVRAIAAETDAHRSPGAGPSVSRTVASATA